MLCVLGAGNGNDLDLARLATLFDRIHLVDIDADALRAGTSRHPVAAADVREHGHLDLSVLTGEEVVQTLGERADVVVSATVLTQLIDDARATTPTPLTPDTLAVVRAAHLSQMIRLTRHGGAGVLVNDLVSSHTLPDLDMVADRALPQLMLAVLQAGNFFAGSNPYAVCAHLAGGAGLPGRVKGITLHPPWVWRMGHRTSRLTYAVSYRRPETAGP